MVDTSRPAPHRSVHRHTEAAVLFSFLVQPQLLVLNHQTAFNNPYQPASQPAAGYMSAMAEEYDEQMDVDDQQGSEGDEEAFEAADEAEEEEQLDDESKDSEELAEVCC